MTLNLIVSLSLLVASANGFGVVPAGRSFAVVGISSQSRPVVTSTQLCMEESESSSDKETEAPPAADESASAAEEEVVELTKEEEEKPKEEDAELKKLKEEIASLEKTLKDKRRYLASTQDKADEFTKTGYARRVAEMENMRRARKMLQNSNAAGSMASTLAEFLPVYDRLQELSNLYSEDEFGKQYNALLSSMSQAFTDLGVTEYSVKVGAPVDALRMIVLESVPSDQYPVDTVVEVRRPGWELQGNGVRLAEVVASSGAAAAEEAPAAEAPAPTEESAE